MDQNAERAADLKNQINELAPRLESGETWAEASWEIAALEAEYVALTGEPL